MSHPPIATRRASAYDHTYFGALLTIGGMNMTYTKGVAKVTCSACQEAIDVGCEACGHDFRDGEEIYCNDDKKGEYLHLCGECHRLGR